MKKLFIMLCLCTMAVCASAQKVGVWYGLNMADSSIDGVDSELKALNLGVDYTAPINDMFDWSAGLSFLTKGVEDLDLSYLQIDVNARWNFLTDNATYKVGFLAGPYIAYMVNDDDLEESNKLDFGIGGGIQGEYKNIFLRIGYEYGFMDCSDWIDSQLSGLYFRIGYAF